MLADNFLVAEEGEADKILCFSTKTALGAAKSRQYNGSKQFSGDGTFKRAPKPLPNLYYTFRFEYERRRHICRSTIIRTAP